MHISSCEQLNMRPSLGDAYSDNSINEFAASQEQRPVSLKQYIGDPDIGDTGTKTRGGRTSRFAGVGASNNRSGTWQARILVHGKVTHLGYYKEEEDAARAYDRVSLALNNLTATNFPASSYNEADIARLRRLDRASLQQALGVKPMQKSSKFRGVSRKKNKWEAKVMVQRKWAYRELFSTEEEAARGYDAAVWSLKPPDVALAFVNFKDRGINSAFCSAMSHRNRGASPDNRSTILTTRASGSIASSPHRAQETSPSYTLSSQGGSGASDGTTALSFNSNPHMPSIMMPGGSAMSAIEEARVQNGCRGDDSTMIHMQQTTPLRGLSHNFMDGSASGRAGPLTNTASGHHTDLLPHHSLTDRQNGGVRLEAQKCDPGVAYWNQEGKDLLPSALSRDVLPQLPYVPYQIAASPTPVTVHHRHETAAMPPSSGDQQPQPRVSIIRPSHPTKAGGCASPFPSFEETSRMIHDTEDLIAQNTYEEKRSTLFRGGLASQDLPYVPITLSAPDLFAQQAQSPRTANRSSPILRASSDFAWQYSNLHQLAGASNNTPFLPKHRVDSNESPTVWSSRLPQHHQRETVIKREELLPPQLLQSVGPSSQRDMLHQFYAAREYTPSGLHCHATERAAQHNISSDLTSPEAQLAGGRIGDTEVQHPTPATSRHLENFLRPPEAHASEGSVPQHAINDTSQGRSGQGSLGPFKWSPELGLAALTSTRPYGKPSELLGNRAHSSVFRGDDQQQWLAAAAPETAAQLDRSTAHEAPTGFGQQYFRSPISAGCVRGNSQAPRQHVMDPAHVVPSPLWGCGNDSTTGAVSQLRHTLAAQNDNSFGALHGHRMSRALQQEPLHW